MHYKNNVAYCEYINSGRCDTLDVVSLENVATRYWVSNITDALTALLCSGQMSDSQADRIYIKQNCFD